METNRRDRAFPRLLSLHVKDLPRLWQIIESFETPTTCPKVFPLNPKDQVKVSLKLRKRDLLAIKLAVNLEKVEKR